MQKTDVVVNLFCSLPQPRGVGKSPYVMPKSYSNFWKKSSFITLYSYLSFNIQKLFCFFGDKHLPTPNLEIEHVLQQLASGKKFGEYLPMRSEGWFIQMSVEAVRVGSLLAVLC